MTETSPSYTYDADYAGGVEYWATQDATVDGVLGGYGNLSRIDALSSRSFLLTVCQRLSAISKASSPSRKLARRQRKRALDVGSGIGRVSSSVLLPLVDSVDLVEPLEHFINEAHRAAKDGQWKSLKTSGSDSQQKLVRFYQKGLQDFEPKDSEHDGCIGTLGSLEDLDEQAKKEEQEPGYDVIWCQWCLGHRTWSPFFLLAVSPLYRSFQSL